MNDNWYIIPDLGIGEINLILHVKIIKLLSGGGSRIFLRDDRLAYDEIPLAVRKKNEDKTFEFYISGGIFIDSDEKKTRIEKSAIDILRSDTAFAAFESENIFGDEDSSLKKILDRGGSIGESTLRNIKKMVYRELYPQNTHDENRLRFVCEADFSFRNYIYKEFCAPCGENICFKYKWYDYSDLDEQELVCLLERSHLYNLIITDNSDGISNFIYNVNFIEHNKFVLAINDAENNLGNYIETINTDILNGKYKIQKYSDIGDI